MSRFTLRHAAFADFGVEQPGEIVTLGWPAPGRELVLPETGWRFPAGNEDQHWRNYTVRAHDPERAEIDVDFFLHGDAGRAASWALTAPRPATRSASPGRACTGRAATASTGRCSWPTRPGSPRCSRSSRRSRRAIARPPSPRSSDDSRAPGRRDRGGRRSALALARGPPARHDDGPGRRRGRARSPARERARVGRRRGAGHEAVRERGPRARPPGAGARLLEARRHARRRRLRSSVCKCSRDLGR